MRLNFSRTNLMIGAALIDVRCDETKRAITTLEPAIEKFYYDPNALIDFAQILAKAGYPINKVIKLAYRARRLGIDSPRIHMVYLWLMFQAEKEMDLSQLQKVEIDTAVQLYSDGQTKWYVIIDDETADNGRNELHKTHPLAERLLDHKKNEPILLTEHPMRNVMGEIKDIQSKYIRASQETMEDFNMKFPKELGLVRLPVSLDDPSKIAYIPIPNSDHVKVAFDSYIKGDVPLILGSIAKFVGRDVIDVWGELVFSPDGKLKAATGQVEERRFQAKQASEASDMTLELVALLTLHQLDYLDTLTARFENIYVAQSLIDDLSGYIHQKQWHGKDGAKFMGWANGLPRLTEIPPEQVQESIEHFEGVKTFLRKNCTVIPVTSILELGKTAFERYESICDRQQIDSILIAKQTDSLLYSDDLWLRVLAGNEFFVPGSWTQAILNEFVQRKLIAIEDYRQAVIELILMNYKFVFVDKDILTYSLETNDWQTSGRVEKVFQYLSGPYISATYAAQVLAGLLKDVWYGPLLLDEQKLLILDLCLHVLVKNRNGWQAINTFRAELYPLFYLDPINLAKIERHINLWIRTH